MYHFIIVINDRFLLNRREILILEDHPFKIKNSAHFIEQIRDIDIPNDHVLMLLDVTSLFTNIPNDLDLEGIESRRHLI